MNLNISSVLATALAFTLATAAAAQDPAAPAAPTPFVTLSGTAAFVSDYRFRGVSLSDRDIAGQGSITATTAPGFFVGIWGSSIAPVGPYLESDGSTNVGSRQEIDLTGGFTKTFGAITPSVGVIGYVYPGGAGVDYYELFGSVAGTLGPVALTVGVNYAPDQDNLFEDNFYVFGLASAAIPGTPLTVKASVGREKGAFDYGQTKIDWMAGVDFKYKILTFSVQYIGSDVPNNVGQPLRHNSKDGVVGSITAAF